jgi:AcrR family transcriptional regulator
VSKFPRRIVGWAVSERMTSDLTLAALKMAIGRRQAEEEQDYDHHYHFEDKEALFLAILATYLERVEEMLLQVQAEGNTCRQRIRLLVQRILRQPAEQRAVIRLASQEIVQVSAPARQAFRVTYHKKFIDIIQAMIEAGIASGELRPMDPHLAIWALLGMIHPYLYPPDSDDVELSDEAIEQMLTIYLDGVTMPEE